MRSKFRFSLAAIVFMAVGVLVPTPAGAAGAPTPTFVAGGFDSPRGVEFFRGTLVVGEAGHGGKNCIPGTPTICFGRTSQISWVNIANQTHTPLVDHLFSAAEFFNPAEGEALGVDGISARDGKLMAILGVFPQAFANYQCASSDSECQADVAAANQQFEPCSRSAVTAPSARSSAWARSMLATLSGHLFRVHGTSATLVDNPLLKHVWKLGLGHESDDGDSNHDSS